MITVRWAGRLVAAMALALPPVLTPAFAEADDQLQVSTDAQHWHPDLDHPLFDPTRRWVPGDATTATFWIRNTADTDGHLGVTAEVDDVDALMAHGLLLRARTADRDWVALPIDGTAQVLPTNIAAGSTAQIWVTASLSSTAGNAAQDRHLNLDFRLTLTELTGSGGVPTSIPGPGSQPGTPSEPTGSLAGTGLTKDALGIAIVAVVTISAGAAAIGSGRRRNRDHG